MIVQIGVADGINSIQMSLRMRNRIAVRLGDSVCVYGKKSAKVFEVRSVPKELAAAKAVFIGTKCATELGLRAGNTANVVLSPIMEKDRHIKVGDELEVGGETRKITQIKVNQQVGNGLLIEFFSEDEVVYAIPAVINTVELK